MRNKVLDPLLFIGMQGVWGLIFHAILLPIYQMTSCKGEDALCHHGHIEDTIGALKEYKSNPILIMYSLIIMVCILTYNVTGIMVTKYASAAQRSTLDVTRTLFVWVTFLLLGQETFLIGEFLGFVCLIIGTLTYNEIIELPF